MGSAARYKLKATQVGKAKKAGMVNDGGGLYLSTSKSLSQSWIYRYKRHGKSHDLGLGSASTVSLAEARELADAARKAVQTGQDPRRAIKGDIGPKTFKDCADEYIKAHSQAWKNAKHKSQWENTLSTYAFPKIGDLPVAQIDTEHVLSAVQPIWGVKTETASRVRMRIENILAWATAMGYREGFNPAIWGGHLDKLLPARAKVQPLKHFAALDYEEIPTLYRELSEKSALSAKGLRFTLLTACRTGEVIGARWGEIDGDNWRIPKGRMKAGVAHTVPLSPAAVALLDELDPDHQHLFPSLSGAGHMSNIAMLKLLKTIRPGMTVHGFRSSFRDWAAETTNYQNHIVEMALAHSIKNQTEKAYRRGDMLEKRRALMNDWAAFCLGDA